MGQEIASSQFDKYDFQHFAECLRQETGLLESWFREHRFAAGPSMSGFELEAWLVDAEGRPAPINQTFLERLKDPLVVPELSVFNVEFNTLERRLEGDVFSRMHAAFQRLWEHSGRAAGKLGARLAMIGILPTVREQDLTVANMSRMVRYRALNEQVLRMRRGKPMQLDIRGSQVLRTRHRDVMLEAATTSFQVHLQINEPEAVDLFNTAVVLSAPMVAVAANAPYLFGKDLWDETRVPLFEQAVAVGGDITTDDPANRRVTFGGDYLRQSMLELFLENRDRYPPLLPMCLDEPRERMGHLRLQNGTIWRWNRPLIGFDRGDGTPHLRIEHRVMAAGPSIVDMIANAALFYGLVHGLGRQETPPARRLSFAESRRNFYRAAQRGLLSELVWLDGKRVSMNALLLEELLPQARRGLESLHIDRGDIDAYLGVVEARVRSGCTGARWQRAYVARHHCDMATLTGAYLAHQESGLPVHEWGFAD